MRRPLGFLALATSFLGCAARESYTEVLLRDPRNVTLRVDTPHGREVVLPPGAATAEVELPKSSPPYVGVSRVPIFARREETGETLLRCDECPWQQGTPVIPPSGQIVFDDAHAHSLRWEGDELVWKVGQTLRAESGHGRYRYPLSVGVAEVHISTPASNVRSAAWVEKSVSRGGGVAELAMGLVFAGAGVALASGQSGDPRQSKAAEDCGIGLVLVGIPLALLGVITVLPDSRTPIGRGVP